MSEQIVTVFHTTDKCNVQSILNQGFNISEGKKHWLGKGVYFYKDIYFAIQWGIIGVDKDIIDSIDVFSNKCAILSADLDFVANNVLDLNTPDGYSIFIALKKNIRKFYSKDKYEEICNKGDAYLFYVFELLESKFNIKLISNYDIICAEYDSYIYKKKRSHNSDFSCCKERQICVKNPCIVSNICEIDLKEEKINNLFDLMKENRSDLNG